MTTETDPKVAQNRSHTTSEPVPASQVDHDALYGALRRLLRVCRDHADVILPALRSDRAAEFDQAVTQARNLLFPPPLPDGPVGVDVVYARVVRPHDSIYLGDKGFVAVLDVELVSDPLSDRLVFVTNLPSGFERWMFAPDEVLIRRPGSGE